jgi:multimeric flavodoxin WrbA
MRATILLGTLKKTGLSNTETLCEFLVQRMERSGVHGEIVKLVDRAIPPGTYTNMGEGDDWPAILETLRTSEIVIFATPVWWSNHSSLIQRAIERLDELHDKLMAGEPSGLEGKAGGVVITGDSDGAQHIIGNILNFFNAIGLDVPAYATLSVLWDRQAKKEKPSRDELLRKYEEDYGKTADRMIAQLVAAARVKQLKE